ncbi:hypothetical protein FACS1894151_07290 [Spirochaetia bacterium]|nr:hypothetical protein FACS1894151_07290 [Spirochaetia bacterium]
MNDINRSRISYYVLCVGEFARQKKLAPKEAFNYLHTYKGIDFLIECYEAEHTLSLYDSVEDLTLICKNNGGELK